LTAESVDNYKTKNNSLSYHIYFDCPNDLNGQYISLSSVQQNFNPQLRKGNNHLKLNEVKSRNSEKGFTKIMVTGNKNLKDRNVRSIYFTNKIEKRF